MPFRVRPFPSTSNPNHQHLLMFYSMEKHRQRVRGRAISPAISLFPYRFQKCWLFYHCLLKGRKREMLFPLTSVVAGLSWGKLDWRSAKGKLNPTPFTFTCVGVFKTELYC